MGCVAEACRSIGLRFYCDWSLCIRAGRKRTVRNIKRQRREKRSVVRVVGTFTRESQAYYFPIGNLRETGNPPDGCGCRLRRPREEKRELRNLFYSGE